MCGIGAFQLKEGDGDPTRLAQALLRNLMVRGTHASGVAWHDDEINETWVQKSNITGAELAKGLKGIGRCAIVHTRYATLGSPKNNLNNHPIDVNGMIGVHNGHISNDDALIAELTDYQRKAQVDSEAAFAYLMHGPKKGGLSQRLSKIQGGAALFWLHTRGKRKMLHVARLQSSPVSLGFTAKGSAILASTTPILKQACKDAGIEISNIVELAEGTYMRFEDGAITQMGDVPITKPAPYKYSSYSPTPIQRASEPKVSRGTGSYQAGGGYKTQLDLFLDELDEQAVEEANAQFDWALENDRDF